MATIAENLQALNTAKNDIKTAIEAKGQDLTDVPFTGYAAKIAEIETGGGGENKLAQVIDGTLPELTAEDFAGATQVKTLSLAGVKKIEFPSTITTIAANAFSYASCEHIKLNEGLKTIGTSAFQYTRQLKTINIPSTVSELPEKCFYGGNISESITFNEGLLKIGTNCFRDCKMPSISLPNSLTTLMLNAFLYCSKIKTVDIGTGIKSISGDAFLGCVGVERFTIRATTPPTLSGTLGSNFPTTAIIEVPAQSLEAYKTATNWTKYADQMVAIEE